MAAREKALLRGQGGLFEAMRGSGWRNVVGEREGVQALLIVKGEGIRQGQDSADSPFRSILSYSNSVWI